jgi:imidazolonepropionase
MTKTADIVFTNANLATFDPASPEPYGAVTAAGLAIADGVIVWVGRASDMPAFSGYTEHDCGGAWITPGLVDCHTHLVFAGDRAREFEQRLEGASYEEIAHAGGGILSTVKATRAACEDELFALARQRIAGMRSEGVTTVEIKSGYGLDLETEMKMLQVADRLSSERVCVQKTFLGAHATPPGLDSDDYIDGICENMIPAIAAAGLADAVDGFCETIGFSPAQIRRVFDAAKKHDFPVKLHAEQLSDQAGTQLATEYNAMSADHLEYLSDAGVEAMAKAGTVAVLLPGAFYFLKETQLPPIAALRQNGVPIALATDFNPGSSPISSPLLILNMACTLFGLTPEEALKGLTINGAKALRLNSVIGSLEVGKRADLAIWELEHPAELCYWMGRNPLKMRVFDGKLETDTS